jgi:hypothetical protein
MSLPIEYKKCLIIKERKIPVKLLTSVIKNKKILGKQGWNHMQNWYDCIALIKKQILRAQLTKVAFLLNKFLGRQICYCY